jgi:leader peptidase (prepilin peptidase)/N-methyltransferase
MDLNILWIVYSTLFAAIIGSFLACMIYRIPRKQNIYASSSCPNCGHQLEWYVNIPIFSWLVLGGYSKCCKQKISMRYLWIELLSAGVGFLLAYLISPLLVLGLGFMVIVLSIIISKLTINKA